MPPSSNALSLASRLARTDGHNRSIMSSRELTEPEQRLKRAIEAGRALALAAGNDANERDARKGSEWGADRTIRASVLVELLTGSEIAAELRPRAIQLAFARIDGMLDLASREILCPLELHACFFDQTVDLDEARLRRLAIVACHLPSLKARQLSTAGNLDLTGSHIGRLDLCEAHVAGQLLLINAELSNPGGETLNANGIHVDGDMFCRAGFRSNAVMRSRSWPRWTTLARATIS